MFRVHVKFGWDKTIYRTFRTKAQCERFLDKVYRQYLPSQIVATWIRRAE